MSLVAQTVKTLPAVLGDPGLIPGAGRALEKEMATHSSSLGLGNSTEEPVGLQSRESQRVRKD